MAKKILKIIAIILGVFVAAFALLLVFLSVTEYKPKDREAVEVIVPADPAAQDSEQDDAEVASEPVLSGDAPGGTEKLDREEGPDLSGPSSLAGKTMIK